MKTGRKICLVLGLYALMRTAVNGAEVAQWNVFEDSYTTAEKYANPFTDVEVDVIFSQEDRKWVVPAFWAGGDKWMVRFAPPTPDRAQ